MADDRAGDPGFAPAKVNLTLHLEGRRPDGYHRLRSLVVFPDVGDRVVAQAQDGLDLTVSGPFSGAVPGQGNLVLRAAEALARHHHINADAAMHLEKVLPVASGIGGGSSDAAAAIRVLSALWGVDVPADLALSLGADVPVCLNGSNPAVMSRIGEILHPVPALPALWIVLVNPLVELPTGAVFSGVADRSPPPGTPMPVDGFHDFSAFRDWLHGQRNDLQASAVAICPEIGVVLTALAQAPLARMSGSGASCFALYPDELSALAAARALAADSDWWVSAAKVLATG